MVFSDIFVSAYLLTRIITRFVYLGKIIGWRKINSKNKNKWKRFEDYLSISYLNDVIIFLTKEVNIESEFRKTHWKIRLSNFDLLNIIRKNKPIVNINEIYNWCILDYDNTYIDSKKYKIEDFATFFNAYKFNAMFNCK